jgi:hypothetical protein
MFSHAPVKNLGFSLARQRLNRHQQSARAMLLVSVMLAGDPTRLHLQPRDALADQKARALVETDARHAARLTAVAVLPTPPF